jgi:hypothetical protein
MRTYRCTMTLPIRSCHNCGKPIPVPAYMTNREYASRVFCSRTCHSGKFHHHWGGGRYKVNDGYIHVGLGASKHMLEHRVVAGKALGRPLRRGEAVHHVNGDKTDNRNRNLVICTNAYNRWLHERMAQLYMQEHFPRQGAM